MKHQASFVFVMLIASVLVSCATPATLSTASPTLSNSSAKPGEAIGEMVLEIAKDETGEPSIFNFCSPIITESDPAIIVRTCSVPQLSYIFIGYGEFAGSLEELDSIWNNETWELYFDGHPVNLSTFGVVNTDWNGNKLRQWKVALENLTPGEHKLRYVIGKVDKSHEPTDATWVFTVGDTTSVSTPSSTSEKITYPPLSSTTNVGQHSYTSEGTQLNFLFYLPTGYEKDSQKQWPLILYLHGSGSRGNNLDYLKVEGLPKKLESQTDFPFIVASPQVEDENEYWSNNEMINRLFALLGEIQANYSVDSKRIYLTGVSLGGGGTWEIGLRYPKRFAALVPVMGFYGYPFEVPANICDLKDVPIWAYHGAKDETVPLDAEEGLVNALKTCGGNTQFTIFPNAGHEIANEVYANPDLYKWMLSQTLK